VVTRTDDQAELRAQLAALQQRVGALEARLAPRGPRDRHDVALVHSIAVSVGGLNFSAAALWRRRAVDPALAAAIRACDLDNAKQLGKLLRRMEGRDVGGLTCVRLGAERDGVVWTLRECESANTSRVAG
jgi:hypothetical protein